jgi:hypothetical protein
LTAQDSTENSGPPRDYFATTRWTVVLAAGSRSTPQADVALEELCRTYWYPLYAYVRRHGHSREDAEDLTQSFFARFLQKNYLEKLSGQRMGPFAPPETRGRRGAAFAGLAGGGDPLPD